MATHPIETLDPRKLHSIPPMHLLRALYERLVRFEPDGRIHPAIAKTIEISSDQKTYTFCLRESYWSDGSPIIAEEFIGAWKQSIASKTIYVKNWYHVKNGKEVVNNQLPFDQLGVAAPDARTIVIQLERPAPYFLELMEEVSCSPVKRGIDLINPQWAFQFDESYLCNGPFRIAKGKGDQMLLLEKNPFYWDADAVQLDRMEIFFVDSIELAMDLFESGRLDWIGLPYMYGTINRDSIKENHPLFFSRHSASAGLLCNVTRFPLSEVNLRKALAHSINRKGLCKIRKNGDVAASSALLPKYRFHDYFSQEEDLEKARFYFAQFLREKNSTPAALSFTITGIEQNQNILEFLQEQWKKNLGIDVVIQLRESKALSVDLNTGNFQMGYGSLLCGRYNDPVEEFSHFLSPVARDNLAHWSNSAFIRLVDVAQEQSCRPIRSTLLAWAEEIMMDQLPFIPLFYPQQCYAKNPHLHNEFTLHAGHVDLRWAFFSKSA